MSHKALLISAGLAFLLLAGVISVLVVQDQIVGAFTVGVPCAAFIGAIVAVSRHLAGP